MITCKFGGTSLKDSSAFERVSSILSDMHVRDRLVVVLSASSGITNRLFELANNCLGYSENDLNEHISSIISHHDRIASDILPDADLDIFRKEFSMFTGDLQEKLHGVRLLNEITDSQKARIVSFGEYFTSFILYHKLLSLGINAGFSDARTAVRTNSNALNATAADDVYDSIRNDYSEFEEMPDVTVTQGFIGSDSSDRLTLLGRGGSDLSAALIGSALGADEIRIYTDVSGIMSADPVKVTDALTIRELSFDEVRELSFYGARVLHPETIRPAVEKNIPVKVINTHEPEGNHSIIRENAGDHQSVVNHVGTVISISSEASANKEEDHIRSLSRTFNSYILYLSGRITRRIIFRNSEISSAEALKEFLEISKGNQKEYDCISITNSGFNGNKTIDIANRINDLYQNNNIEYFHLGNSILVLFETGNIADPAKIHSVVNNK